MAWVWRKIVSEEEVTGGDILQVSDLYLFNRWSVVGIVLCSLCILFFGWRIVNLDRFTVHWWLGMATLGWYLYSIQKYYQTIWIHLGREKNIIKYISN